MTFTLKLYQLRTDIYTDKWMVDIIEEKRMTMVASIMVDAIDEATALATVQGVADVAWEKMGAYRTNTELSTYITELESA